MRDCKYFEVLQSKYSVILRERKYFDKNVFTIYLIYITKMFFTFILYIYIYYTLIIMIQFYRS
jgi:hypothetical protein